MFEEQFKELITRINTSLEANAGVSNETLRELYYLLEGQDLSDESWDDSGCYGDEDWDSSSC